jgi:hypothetical protein
MIAAIGEGRGTEFTGTTYITENSSIRKRNIEYELDATNIFTDVTTLSLSSGWQYLNFNLS